VANALASERYGNVRQAHLERLSNAACDQQLGCGKILQPIGPRRDALWDIRLHSGDTYADPGNNVIELNRNYRGNVVIRIGIV